MSWEATNWAVSQLAGSPGAKIVLLLLADRADDKNSCWPSQERLATESEQSIATVRRRLRDLETLGLIWTERRNIPGMKRATNRYFLAVTSSAQSATQTIDNDFSTAQNGDLPLKSQQVYRSPVSAKPSSEPSITEPPERTKAFDEFYAAYPKKKQPGYARDKAWPKAIKKADPAVIIHGAVLFRQWCERNQEDPQFIPYPASWLNAESWNDELTDKRADTKSDGWVALFAETVDNESNSYPQLEG